jgi:hypothetical protein
LNNKKSVYKIFKEGNIIRLGRIIIYVSIS